MMTFTKYRAAVLKIFWPKAQEFLGMRKRDIINHENFKPSAIDNLCATYWKYDDPISACVDNLLSYIRKV